MYLRTLSDAELLRFANAQIDRLHTTDLERELIRRFEDFTDLGYDQLIEVLENRGYDVDDAKETDRRLEQLDDERNAAQERVEELTGQLDEANATLTELRERIAELEAQPSLLKE